MAHQLPTIKLAWFAVASLIGGLSACFGYLSKSGERTSGAALVAFGNGLLIGLFASLLASRYSDCDPVWLILGAMTMGWPSGLIGVVRTMALAWQLKESALSFMDAVNAVRQQMKSAPRSTPTDGSPPSPRSPPVPPHDAGSNTKLPS